MNTIFTKTTLLLASFFVFVIHQPVMGQGVSALSDEVWVSPNNEYYYQVPVSFVPIGDEAAASIRINEFYPYRRVSVVNGEYAVLPVSKREFDALSSSLVSFGMRMRGDFDGDGKEDLILQTQTGDELFVSQDTVRPFDINTDLSAIDDITLVDVNADNKKDLLRESDDTVQYATVDGFTAAVGSSEYVGTLSGQSNVSPNGNFTYELPITTGESTGALKPNLALSYSSSPNNGYLGVGWGITGLSAISRCEQNIETDGPNNATKVNFTRADRFCLDGQRLIARNGQTYGASGTEYRTAQDSFHKILSTTSNLDRGPDTFSISDTKGNLFTYGRVGSDQTGIIKTPDNKHFAWALKKVQDSSGNYYTYHYQKVSGSLEYYLTEIRYSGHTSHAPRNKVVFSYSNRSDTSESYIAGYKTSVTKRLNQITSYYDSQILKKYKLAYRYDNNSFGQAKVNLLTSVTACDSQDRCISPTKFAWNSRNVSGISGTIDRDFSRTSRYKGHQMLDFNGDGLMDIAYVRNDRGSSTDHLFMIRNDGSRGLTKIRDLNNLASSSFRRTWKVVDYDKDGDDDILYNSGGWRLLRYISGNNFSNTRVSGLPTPSNDANSRFVDMDADGLPDLMHIVNNQLRVHQGTKSGVSNSSKSVSLNLRRYLTNSSVSLLDYDRDDNTFTSTDFNGDGRADFIVQVRERAASNPPPGPGPGPGPIPCGTRRCIPYLQEDNPKLSINNLDSDIVSVQLADEKPSPIIASDPSDLVLSDTILETGAYLPSKTGYSDKEYASLLEAMQIDTKQDVGGLNQRQSSTQTYWRVVLSEQNGSNYKLSEYARLWTTSSVDKVQPINLNGDALTDLVYRRASDKNWFAVINNGNGFNAPISVMRLDEEYLATMDVNSDGAAEILYKSGSFLYYKTYKNGTFHNTYYGREDAAYDELNFADMDGDGVQDKFIFKGRSRTQFRTDTGTNRIVSVTDGFGAIVRANYSTLNDPSVYTRRFDGKSRNWGNGSLVADIKGAIPVVSSLSKNGDLLRYQYVGVKAQIGRGLLVY